MGALHLTHKMSRNVLVFVFVLLCFDASLAQVATAFSTHQNQVCRDAVSGAFETMMPIAHVIAHSLLGHLNAFTPPPIATVSASFDNVKQSCADWKDTEINLFVPEAFANNSRVTKLINTMRAKSSVDVDVMAYVLLHAVPNLLSDPLKFVADTLASVQNVRTRQNKKEDALQAETLLETPIMLYLSPNTWWVRADPLNSQGYCYEAHAIAYIVSWIGFGMFLVYLQRAFEMDNMSVQGQVRKLSMTYGLAFISCFLYAVLVQRCADLSYSEPVTPVISKPRSCSGSARLAFNFLWPGLVTVMYGWLLSFHKHDPAHDTSGFIKALKDSKKPLANWVQGHELHSLTSKAQTIPDDSNNKLHSQMRASSPPLPPMLVSDVSPLFFFGLFLLTMTITVWLRQCTDEQ